MKICRVEYWSSVAALLLPFPILLFAVGVSTPVDAVTTFGVVITRAIRNY